MKHNDGTVLRKISPIKRKCEKLFPMWGGLEVAPFSHCKGTGSSWWCHLMNKCNGTKEF